MPSYDPRKDFAPLGLIASAPALLLPYNRDLPVPQGAVGELDRPDGRPRGPYQVAGRGRRHRQLPRFRCFLRSELGVREFSRLSRKAPIR